MTAFTSTFESEAITALVILGAGIFAAAWFVRRLITPPRKDNEIELDFDYFKERE